MYSLELGKEWIKIKQTKDSFHHLVPGDFFSESISHHLTKNLFFALCLSCKFGATMTKPGDIVLCTVVLETKERIWWKDEWQ